MSSERGLSKLSLGQFALFSILLQLLPFLIFLLVYGFDNCISYGKHQVCLRGGDGYGYLLIYPYINYFVFFGVVMINAVQSTTKSELLASAMNLVLILFIWTETKYSFYFVQYDYLIFMLCLTLTLPIRLLLRRSFDKSNV
ncbi:MAG: hypothetical protein AB8B56_04360 [Crocinitomicaceae bacterium]